MKEQIFKEDNTKDKHNGDKKNPIYHKPKPTGKLKFAYETIANMEDTIQSQKETIEELNVEISIFKNAIIEVIQGDADVSDLEDLVTPSNETN